jgi:hypothetical protein
MTINCLQDLHEVLDQQGTVLYARGFGIKYSVQMAMGGTVVFCEWDATVGRWKMHAVFNEATSGVDYAFSDVLGVSEWEFQG